MTMLAFEVQVVEAAILSVCGVLLLFLMNELASIARWAVVPPREWSWLLAAGLVWFGLVAFEIVVVSHAGLQGWVYWPMTGLLGVSVGLGWTSVLRALPSSIRHGATP